MRFLGVDLDRCGILPDTPEIRLELQRGIALDDELTVPELPDWPF